MFPPFSALAKKVCFIILFQLLLLHTNNPKLPYETTVIMCKDFVYLELVQALQGLVHIFWALSWEDSYS